MISPAVGRSGTPPPWLPASFRAWREAHVATGVQPIIAVAGSRGKTTVVRLLDAIFSEAGLRTTLWTDQGVEVEGRRQRGELVPWSRALERFGDGSLDVAIQELDWATVHAVGLPAAVYPLVAVTNLCANSDPCLAGDEGRRAIGSLGRVRDAVRPGGRLILAGEDAAVAALGSSGAATVLVAVNREIPVVRAHLRAGGVAAWAAENELRFGTNDDSLALARIDRLPLALAGALGFQVSNALLAVATATACGIGPRELERALRSFLPLDSRAPGSFNVVDIAGATMVVDRPAPSWFLRPALRAVGHLRPTRLVSLFGRGDGIDDADLVETGRLLGRAGGALVLHSMAVSSHRAAQLRRGIAANDVPPVVFHVPSERLAIRRALEMLRPGDVGYVLADHPAAALRAIERARETAHPSSQPAREQTPG